jgi:flagellar hook protein FlgE
MLKSLYSGVSGMSANMTELDVIGNNIANSNTIGFKSGRVTFNEMLTQTIRSASRPVSGGLGGTNPQQVGLGARVGSIDTNFNQGNFQATGMKTDLAIQGAGFFILSDGTSSSYTRAGVFGLDGDNCLVNPSTGLRVQGLMADADGLMGAGSLGDLIIDPSLVVPAQASSEVQLTGNLDANSDATGTIMESPAFLAAAAGSDLLVDMSGSRDGSLGLRPNDVITVNYTPGTAETFTVTAASTYQDLVTWLNTVDSGLAFTIGTNGRLEVANTSGATVTGLQLTSGGNTQFSGNLSFPNSIADGTSANTETATGYGALRANAETSDTLENLYTTAGNQLGINFASGSATLVISGLRGGDAVPDTQFAVTTATTLGELLTRIDQTLGVTTNPAGISEEGRIVVNGEAGVANGIGSISIAELGVDNTDLSDAFLFTSTQQAGDQQDFSVSTTTYDSLGREHTIAFRFEKLPGLNEWIWEAEMEGGETVVSGQSGRMSFNPNGSIANFTYDDGTSSLTFQPQPVGEEGAALVTLAIDFGEIGGLTGLTQFDGSGRLQSVADGYTSGQLVDYEIDQSGMIVGRFSNDTMRTIGRIGIAQFTNPSGLVRESNNTYVFSGNSGDANTVFAGEGNGLSLATGALEASNVDLAKEFARLVIAQRAFQANSRVVTTADTLLQELVNLVR